MSTKFKKTSSTGLAGLFAAALLGSATLNAADVDPAIPVYESTSGVSGNLSSVGSDTLATLM